MKIIISKIQRNFFLENALPDIVEIYNNNIHSSTKYKPIYLFNTNDKNIINRVVENIKKSKKNFNDNSFKIDTKCLLCENFELGDNTIKLKCFVKKNIFYSLLCYR